ncbi:DUF3883 domain-containing protein [Streptomyces sp. SID10815]|uniref:protein NO VEIN domain-containing protein n=1 Tax=Streptomyces sp. SID10815 TaxID=2706027 RepID=UPI0013CCAFC6|nr:DUF3883 domain-containing protein [Streptomyces sp. SID10815]NEA46545.1 DUF3883 domain-containing protein [Streptomyces sp. SID10815]
MTLLPSHGRAFSVLLLAHAAVRVSRADVEDWAQAASDRAAQWGRRLDALTTARALFAHGLAEQTREGVRLGHALQALPVMESGAMRAAACLLLTASPPPWLSQAIRAGTVVRDYIPGNDLKVLSWLEPGLDALLLDVAVRHRAVQEDAWRERLGEAAEAVVLSALRRDGRKAIQVSLVSPAYGYDVEVSGPPTERIEVKGAGPETSGSFHLTRHEFDTALRHPDSFCLMQVVFHSCAFHAEVLRAEHVADVKRLTPQALRSIVPEDNATFAWERSALLRPSVSVWQPSALRPAADFTAPGLRRRVDGHSTCGG